MFRDDLPQCPNCHTPLGKQDASIRIGALQPGTAIHYCDDCAGSFVSSDAFATLFRAAKPDLPLQLLEHQDTTAHHRCPICNELMRRMWLDFLSFEQCPIHGLWFDRGGLARALTEYPNEAELAALPGAAGSRPLKFPWSMRR